VHVKTAPRIVSYCIVALQFNITVINTSRQCRPQWRRSERWPAQSALQQSRCWTTVVPAQSHQHSRLLTQHNSHGTLSQSCSLYRVVSWEIFLGKFPEIVRCLPITVTGRMTQMRKWATTEHTHTHAHPFNSPFSGTTQVSRYQKGKTNLDFTEARDSEWQWHQMGLKASNNRTVIKNNYFFSHSVHRVYSASLLAKHRVRVMVMRQAYILANCSKA